MNEQKYRLINGKLHRSFKKDGDPTPTLVTYVGNDVFIPTNTELAIFKNRLAPADQNAQLTIGLKPIQGQGRIAVAEAIELPQTVTDGPTAIITEMSQEERAKAILIQPEPNIREAVRQANQELLAILGDLEALRTPKPRPRIVNMIAGRLKKLARQAE